MNKSEALKRRIHSFIWGGIAGAALIALGIIFSSGGATAIIGSIVVGILAFTFVSCLILDNNFIMDVFTAIISWGFVQMPGLIFTLDLDGIIWLLTVKLLFWIIEILLAIACAILAVVIGAVCSLFVYPFALYKNIVGKED